MKKIINIIICFTILYSECFCAFGNSETSSNVLSPSSMLERKSLKQLFNEFLENASPKESELLKRIYFSLFKNIKENDIELKLKNYIKSGSKKEKSISEMLLKLLEQSNQSSDSMNDSVDYDGIIKVDNESSMSKKDVAILLYFEGSGFEWKYDSLNEGVKDLLINDKPFRSSIGLKAFIQDVRFLITMGENANYSLIHHAYKGDIFVHLINLLKHYPSLAPVSFKIKAIWDDSKTLDNEGKLDAALKTVSLIEELIEKLETDLKKEETKDYKTEVKIPPEKTDKRLPVFKTFKDFLLMKNIPFNRRFVDVLNLNTRTIQKLFIAGTIFSAGIITFLSEFRIDGKLNVIYFVTSLILEVLVSFFWTFYSNNLDESGKDNISKVLIKIFQLIRIPFAALYFPIYYLETNWEYLKSNTINYEEFSKQKLYMRLKDKNPHVRLETCEYLLKQKDKESIKHIYEIIDDYRGLPDNGRNREEYIQRIINVLGEFKDDGIPYLLKSLNNPSSFIRSKANICLSFKLNSKEWQPKNESEEYLRRYAIEDSFNLFEKVNGNILLEISSINLNVINFEKEIKFYFESIHFLPSHYEFLKNQKSQLWFLGIFYEHYPDYFKAKEPLTVFIKTLTKELGLPSDNFSLWVMVSENLPPENLEIEKLKIYTSLLNVVHDDFLTCLNDINKLNLGDDKIKMLMSCLPGKAITSIISNLEDYSNVVEILKSENQFDNFFKLIIQIAKAKGSEAPNHVVNVLDFLRLKTKQKFKVGKIISEKLFEDLFEYLNHDIKIINLKLFSYFRQNKNNFTLIQNLKKDIEKITKDIAWGDFYGFDETIRKKYKLTAIDEINLMSKYFPIVKRSIPEYMSAIENVKNAFNTIGVNNWIKEISINLRTKYSLNGSRIIIKYKTQNVEDYNELRTLEKSLSDLTAPYDKELNLNDVMLLIKGNVEELKKFLINQIFKNYNNDEILKHRDIPELDADKKNWLGLWNTLISDTYKHDYKDYVKLLIHDMVLNFPDDIIALENILSDQKFPWITDKWKVNKNIADGIKEFLEDKISSENLAMVFHEWWLGNMKYEDVSDSDKFDINFNKGFNNFLTEIAKKKNLGRELSEEETTKIKECIYSARNVYLKENKISLRKTQIEKYVFTKLIKVFDDDLIQIKKQLDLFKEIETASHEKLYCGLFDDFLHLCGEFMATGVCIYNDRGRAIEDGKKDNTHFCAIALKNKDGRAQAFSQAQLIKNSYKGKEFPQDFNMLAISSTNLCNDLQLMSDEKSVIALLKTAYLLKEKSGLDAAVIADNAGLISNQPATSAIIKRLAEKNILIKKELNTTVMVSKGSLAYDYKNVFEITPKILEIEDIKIEETFLEDILLPKNENDKGLPEYLSKLKKCISLEDLVACIITENIDMENHIVKETLIAQLAILEVSTTDFYAQLYKKNTLRIAA